MFTSGSSRRRRIASMTVVLLQVALLCMSLLGPAFVSAAEPSADPSATPPPSTEPSAEPSAAPSSEPSAEPTAEPTADPTPAPTPAPTAEPTQPAPPGYVPTGPASIASDQGDYPPGGTVTLTGSNWFAGEIVHIFVNDDFGSTWYRNVDVAADASGGISDQFTLPDWFVANYRVVGTGALSGTVTTTFTDGNINIKTTGPATAPVTWERFSNTTCQSGPGQPIASGTITATNAGNGTAIPGGASASESVRLTAGAVASWTFSSWGNGNFSSTTANPTCLTGDGNTQQTDLIYVAGLANQATLTITAPASATFGAADQAITTSGGSGTGAITFSAGASTACSIVSGQLHVISGTGTCSITATKAGDANFNPTTSAAFTVAINKANQAALTITAPASATFGAADQAITTSGGSGTGAITFNAGASTACSIVSGQLHVISGTGTCSITATKAGDANFNPTTSAAFTVTLNKASQAALSVTGPGSGTYGQFYTMTAAGGSGTGALSFAVVTGSTGCAIVTGGANDGKLEITSGSGTCSITATKAGDNNYNSATSAAFSVGANKASQAALVLTVPASITFGTTGTATTSGGSGTGAVTFSDGTSTGCSVNVSTGVISVSNASGTCAISASKAGDNNYLGPVSDGPTGVTLNKAASTTTVTCTAGAPYTYTGFPQTPCTAQATGIGMSAVNVTASLVYVNNTVGTATATASFGGDANHNGSTGTGTFAILYATGNCLGAPGRQVLQPINADGSSVFKKGSTVPVKFRVCDAAGHSIGTPGVVTSFQLTSKFLGLDPQPVIEDLISTTPDTAFRWSSSDQQWIFNLNTKNLSANYTYRYTITLNDTSTIVFEFGLK